MKKGLKRNPLFTKTEAKTETRPTRQIKSSGKHYPVQVIFYFSPDEVKQLEKIRFDLIQNYNLKTAKSRIIRSGLKIISENLEQLYELLKNE
ncbi:MAG: hypothetical protein AB1297_03280 [bacterium]